MRADHDAIVIGAGPAGATVAILLAQAGWSVALIEKHPFPRRKVCGECLAASNLPLLDALGVGAAFDAVAGPPLQRVAVMWARHTIEAALPAHAHPTRRWGRALGRDTLDALLLSRARQAGAHVLQPYAVRSVTHAGGGLSRCEIAAPHRGATALHAPVVVAAHGSWEPWGGCGAEVGTRAARRPGDLFAFKANYHDARLAAGVLPVLAFDGGYGGMVVADRGRLTLACCIRRDALRALRQGAPGRTAAEAVESHLRSSCAGVRVALDSARREGAWLTVGPLRPGIRMPRAGADDGAFRVGNVAGEAHPIIGEGMSMAMQSAWLLAERLIRHGDTLRAGQARSAVARDYASAWRGAFAPRIRLAALCAHLAMRPLTARALLPLVRVWPGGLTGVARLAGKARCAAGPGTIA